MAQDFRNDLQRQVGTVIRTLVTGWRLMMQLLVSDVVILQLQQIASDVRLLNGGNDHFLAKGVSVPPNSAIELIQGGAKIVLANGDVLRSSQRYRFVL